MKKSIACLMLATALAGYHYLACRTRHLLKHKHRSVRAGTHQKVSGGIRGHESGSTAPDHNDIRFHIREHKKGKA